MNAYPDHGINDPDIASDIGLGEGQRLPHAEAVLAATLALMTGHAQACCEERRWLMLTKTVANLDLLAHHPGVSPGFKSVVAQLHAMWSQLHEQHHEQAAEGARSNSVEPIAPTPDYTRQTTFTQARVLWHASPEILQ